MDKEFDPCYEQHRLIVNEDAEWAIARPKSSVFFARIIARPPYLIVVGDIDTAVFHGHCSDSPLGLVNWVGTSSVGYIASKLSRGMTSPNLARQDCYLDALESAQDHVKHAEDEEEREMWAEIEQMVKQSDDLEEIRRHIAEEVPDGWEIAGSFGYRTSDRVLHARAACRAVLRLLKEK